MQSYSSGRRAFLRQSALTASGLLLAHPKFLERFMPPPPHIGLQLYSVRADMDKDAVKTTEAVAKIGYREVEGYRLDGDKIFNMPIAEYAKVLKNNGLKMHSCHAMVASKDYNAADKSISDAAKKTVDSAAALGLQYFTVPFMIPDDRKDIATMVRLYQATAAYCQKAGVKMAYHNHDFEYKEKGPDGRLLIEWLLHEIDPKQLDMEMDIYWVSFAGHNPTEWFRLYPNRWRLCHAKDMAATEKHETIEVGDGTINFKQIFAQRRQAGLQHYIVELEHYRTTPLEGVAKARKGLLKVV